MVKKDKTLKLGKYYIDAEDFFEKVLLPRGVKTYLEEDIEE